METGMYLVDIPNRLEPTLQLVIEKMKVTLSAIKHVLDEDIR